MEDRDNELNRAHSETETAADGAAPAREDSTPAASAPKTSAPAGPAAPAPEDAPQAAPSPANGYGSSANGAGYTAPFRQGNAYGAFPGPAPFPQGNGYNPYANAGAGYAAYANGGRISTVAGIRRAALITGLSLISMIVMMFVFSFVEGLFIIPLFGSTDPGTGEMYLDDTSTLYYALYLVQYFVMFSLPLIIAYAASGQKGLFRLFRPRSASLDPAVRAAEDGERARLSKRMLPEALLLAPVMVGAAYAMSIVGTMVESTFNIFGFVSPPIFDTDPADPAGWVLYALVLCVAAPVCEEMFFRGAVLNLLKPFGTGFAVACQAILFSVFHGTVSQLPYTVVGGLIMGWLAAKYGGILPSMLLHALNNGISLIISSCIPDSVWEDMQLSLWISLLIYAVFIIGGIVCVKVLLIGDKKLFKAGEKSVADEMPGFSAFAVFLAQPAVLCYICLNMGLMLFSMVQWY